MKNVATGVLLAAAMIFAALMVVSPAAAQRSQAETWCYGDNSTDDQVIAGCTQVIQSGRASHGNLASAYFNRGLGYRHKGDPDRAIADYTQAIQLDPTAAHDYNHGLTYSDQNDLDRSITDYTNPIHRDSQNDQHY